MTKQELIAEIDRSRLALARDFSAVKDEVNFPAKVGKKFQKNPFLWLGGAAALGWMIAGPRTRTKVVKVGVLKEKGRPSKTVEPRPAGVLGVLLTLFKLSIPMLKPALSAYAAKRFAEMAEKLGK
jgi:hypothetical protein